MFRWFRELQIKREYGQPIVVVSGLPRSGTSMMMNMLQAGGLPLVEDRLRLPDEDNPKGYFEMDRVKRLHEETDKSWLAEARGRAVKVISELLQQLPDTNYYRVLFMVREMEEVIASQNKMLARSGNSDSPTDPRELAAMFEAHLTKIRFWLRIQPNFEVLEVPYVSVIQNPQDASHQVRRFVRRPLDPHAMAAVVRPDLYRNRARDLG